MSIDFKLDDITHDLVITDADLVLVNEGTEVAQKVKIHLMTFQGEWHQDVTVGTSWLDDIFQVNTSYAHKETMLRAVIYSVEGVLQIRKFNLVFDNDNRTLYVDAEVDTDFGDAVLSIQL